MSFAPAVLEGLRYQLDLFALQHGHESFGHYLHWHLPGRVIVVGTPAAVLADSPVLHDSSDSALDSALSIASDPGMTHLGTTSDAGTSECAPATSVAGTSVYVATESADFVSHAAVKRARVVCETSVLFWHKKYFILIFTFV